MFLFLLLIIVSTLTYLISTVIKPKNFPPGPKWYPVIGCNATISSRTGKYGSQWKTISEMAKEYSTKILGLKLCNQVVVVVFGEKNIRYVAAEKVFDARPDTFFLRLRSFGKRSGITFVEGSLWREHRGFTLKSFRNSGFAKETMDAHVHEQVSYVLSQLQKSNGSPINIKQFFYKAVLNILWKYVAGENIEQEKLNHLMNIISLRTRTFTMTGGNLDHWPWLRFILPNWSGFTLIMKLNKQLSDIIQEAIVKHKDYSVPGNDLIYDFLREMYANKELYTEDQLRGICLDIIMAGSSTIGNLMDFVLIMLLRYPEVQQKVYEEIRRVIGDKLPTWADNIKLHYTSAFICEVHRCCTVAPFAGGRRALADVEIDGYVIPKGATVLLSLGDLHEDPNTWNEPENFVPERFLDENGKLKAITNIYPFSIGRRRCLAEPLAKSFNFLTIVEIIKNYKIICDGAPPSKEPIIGIFAESRYYTARFIKRVN